MLEPRAQLRGAAQIVSAGKVLLQPCASQGLARNKPKPRYKGKNAIVKSFLFSFIIRFYEELMQWEEMVTCMQFLKVV